MNLQERHIFSFALNNTKISRKAERESDYDDFPCHRLLLLRNLAPMVLNDNRLAERLDYSLALCLVDVHIAL